MSRRSWLSRVLGPAALTGGLLAVNGAAARSEAAEFVGIDGWMNTDAPLKMSGLRGKVVLVEFGTYTCINWRRTLPYVSRWHSEYGPQGLQIICIHTPEFGFERNRPNVESAIRELARGLPHCAGQRIPNLARMGQSGLAVVLPCGRGWTGPAGSRRGRKCAGDRGRHPQPARPCAHRRGGASGGRCRPVARWHTRNVFRVTASYAAGPRTVATAW